MRLRKIDRTVAGLPATGKMGSNLDMDSKENPCPKTFAPKTFA